jgi:hypothetical protein
VTVPDLYESFCALDSDERFLGLGLGLRRKVVDGSLDYAICVSGLELDSEILDAIQAFADDRDLRVLTEDRGSVLLVRQTISE